MHVRPGREAVPVLTDDTTRVLPHVDAALVTGIVVGVLQLAHPRGAPVRAGAALTTVVGILAGLAALLHLRRTRRWAGTRGRRSAVVGTSGTGGGGPVRVSVGASADRGEDR